MKNIQEKINYIKNKWFLLKKESFILEYLDKICMIKLSKYFRNFKQNNTECFSEVIKYYLFDIELINLNLWLLEHIENSLKVQMVKSIWNNYLNKDLYIEKYSSDRIKFVREKVKYLREFDLDTKKQKWGFIDSKVFFDKLTFWELVKFFKTLKYEYKIQISLFYGIKNIHIFESWIFAFRYLRNLCSHWENIFNRKFIKTIEWKKISECFEIKRNNVFISYFTILSFFNKRLNINKIYEEEVLKKIYKYWIWFELFWQKKKPSVFGHYSEELEAWKVLVQPLYDFYIKKSNLNLVEKKDNINISVIMPVYNTEKYLSKSIDSILNQSFRDFEFIIIDDCSTDNSYKICQEYSKKDYRIKLYRNETNMWISVTRNRLINLSKTNYIASQDSDDISELNRLELEYCFLKNNLHYWVVSWNNIIIDEENNIIWYRKYSDDIKNIILKKSPISQPSSMFRKNIFLDVWWYDNKLNYWEDYDLWLKIFCKWYKIKNLEENLLKYRIRDWQTKSKKLKETIKNTLFIQERAIRKYWIKKNFSDKIYFILEKILLYLPSNLVMFLFKKLEYKKWKKN